MIDNRPIGLLDSGVGGLTVARSIMDMLPNEEVVYFGDTLRTPYGPKPLAQVRSFTQQIVEYLLGFNVKMVVIACNTATAATLFDDPVEFPVPTFGVINPAVEKALALTRSGQIGVIGTQGTIESQAYDRALAQLLPADLPRAAAVDLSVQKQHRLISLTSQACPTFVTFAEEGRTSDPEVLAYSQEILAPLKNQHVDTLILGCTHYPLLTGMISYVMGPDVALVSSAETTARKVFTYLVQNSMLAQERTPPQHTFIATGDPTSFANLAARFLGPRIAHSNVSTAALP